jgi:hypothetical protein
MANIFEMGVRHWLSTGRNPEGFGLSEIASRLRVSVTGVLPTATIALSQG